MVMKNLYVAKKKVGAYCVLFFGRDGSWLNEENCYYKNLEDAKAYFNRFKDNNKDYPKKYAKIRLGVYMSDDLIMIYDEIRFPKRKRTEIVLEQLKKLWGIISRKNN